MRILLAVHHFPPHYIGGAEWRAHRTALELIKRGHDVRVICVEWIDRTLVPSDCIAWEDGIYDGIPVRRLSFHHRGLPDPIRGEYNNPCIKDVLLQMMHEWHPDLFHLIGGYLISGSSLQAAREFGIPSVVTLTDFWFLCPRISFLRSNGDLSTLPIRPVTCARCIGEERRRYRYVGKLAPWLANLYWKTRTDRTGYIEERQNFLLNELNQVGMLISPSQFLRNIHIQAGIASDRIIYSRQGRPLTETPLPEMGKSPSSLLRIGYLGQISKIKGVHILLEALSLLPKANLSLTIFGDVSSFPDYASQLKAKAKKDKRVKFAGVYRADEVAKVHRNLDVIVVPSLWYENSPNTILESFLQRTPVIASDLGGMSELVEHEKSGLLFTAGNSSDLSRQISRLLHEPELIERLCKGIPPVKSLGEEIDELESIYYRLAPVS